MMDIKYKIKIPGKALDILANIYSPTKEESSVMRIINFETESESNPFCWNFKKFWHQYAKAITDSDLREEFVADYFKKQSRIAKHRKLGKVSYKNPVFFKNATPISKVADILGCSIDSARACIRNSLFGLVGIVTESFNHSIVTGNPKKDINTFAYLPEGKPIKGKPIRVKRYNGIYVPFQIGEQIQRSIDSEPNEFGNYEILRKFNPSSLPILEYIFKRTQELDEKISKRRLPEFYNTELARVTGFSKEKVRQAVSDLLGILGEIINPINNQRYKRKVILPPCRKELAQELLKKSN